MAQVNDDLVRPADAAPGGVHGVGGTVLVVCADDEHWLGMENGLCAEILTHNKILLKKYIIYMNIIPQRQAKIMDKSRTKCRWWYNF
jgi:hypothetical protein